MKKFMENLGKSLSKQEQKRITGGPVEERCPKDACSGGVDSGCGSLSGCKCVKMDSETWICREDR